MLAPAYVRFEDTKRVIRSCKLKDIQYNAQKKKDKQTKSKNRIQWPIGKKQTRANKTLNRKLNIDFLDRL